MNNWGNSMPKTGTGPGTSNPVPDTRDFVIIKAQLEDEMSKYDLIIGEWAESRARHDKMKEMLKIKLALISELVEAKSSAEKERKAYADPEYRKYVNELFKEDVKYYVLDARKSGIEQRIQVLRSLLSFNKEMININR